MFKKVLFAAAFVVACSPAFVSAQDIFFSFDENSRVADLEVAGATSGTAFIFADENLDFNQLDVDFSVTGPATFGEAAVFNAGNKFTSFDAFDPDNAGSPVTATDGRLIATSFLTPGQVPGSNDADFRAGANGFLLATVAYDFTGTAPGDTANFDFTLGGLGVVNDGAGDVPVSFGSGSVGIAASAIPEPSSAILLILGAAGMVARRRRS